MQSEDLQSFLIEINGEKQKLVSPGLNVAFRTLVSPNTAPITLPYPGPSMIPARITGKCMVVMEIGPIGR